MTTTPQEALKQALDRATSTLHTISQSKDLSGETLAGLAAQALVDVAALSQQAPQETQRPFGTYIERDDGVTEFRRTGERFTPSPFGYKAWTLYTAAPAKPADSLEQILADLRARRDATTGDIRSAYNAVCDRLDVLISHLSAKPAEQEKAQQWTAEEIKAAYMRATERRVQKWADTPDMHEMYKADAMSGLGMLADALEELTTSQQAPSTAAQEQPQVEGAK